MISILKAFRDALAAEPAVSALVPADNSYAGLRDEKTRLPAIDVFGVSVVMENLAGARVGGIFESSEVIQVSIYSRAADASQLISDVVINTYLGDNAALNAAGIKLITLINKVEMREKNISHIALRFRYGYHMTI